MSDIDFLRMHYLRGLVCLWTPDVLLSTPYVTNMPKYNIVFHSKRNSDGFDIGHPILYITFM